MFSLSNDELNVVILAGVILLLYGGWEFWRNGFMKDLLFGVIVLLIMVLISMVW
jgi:hypothetical protein